MRADCQSSRLGATAKKRDYEGNHDDQVERGLVGRGSRAYTTKRSTHEESRSTGAGSKTIRLNHRAPDPGHRATTTYNAATQDTRPRHKPERTTTTKSMDRLSHNRDQYCAEKHRTRPTNHRRQPRTQAHEQRMRQIPQDIRNSLASGGWVWAVAVR